MEVYTSIVEYFELLPLASDATLVDLINYIIPIGVSVYIVAFMIRTLFLGITVPFDKWD